MAGHHAAVIGELDELIALHPLREQLYERRMLALYRAGRQAEALKASISCVVSYATSSASTPASRCNNSSGKCSPTIQHLTCIRRPQPTDPTPE